MPREIEIRLLPDELTQEDILKSKCSKLLGMRAGDIQELLVLKKSLDARKSPVQFLYRLLIYTNDEHVPVPDAVPIYTDVSSAESIHIVGFGPAGMFAALRCIELGYKPVVFERGKKVRERRRDLQAINQQHLVNEESNYCFGEGGAGTYSDGKLYTRSKKRGDVRRILDRLLLHGAPQQIMSDAHPHIGTNKLPKIVENIRETILNCGGEIHFESKLIDFTLDEKKHLSSVVLSDGLEVPVRRLILATGHSARDIYELFDRKNIAIRAKSFALGVRIEHPQHIIDSIQYHCKGPRHEALPAAAYSLVHQSGGRGVYSFCMCPGGFVVPAATAQQEVVVNGMSPSKRNSAFANSGIVVEIRAEEDLKAYEHFGELRCLQFQKEMETMAFISGGKRQTAPAQRLTDFVSGKISEDLPTASYQPGLLTAPLHELLPQEISVRLSEALLAFGRKMKGYFTSEANVIGVESRTSSPISILRNEDLQHPQIGGLYPCGEGAGYAGGIMSAAMDGERCAEAAAGGDF